MPWALKDLGRTEPIPAISRKIAANCCGTDFVTPLLVDTGFLVALYIRGDNLHHAAVSYLRQNQAPLRTAAPVIVETCFFLDASGKTALLSWIAQGGLAVADIPVSCYPNLAAYIQKYADQDIDFVDAALVWLASQTGQRSILTVDESDFLIYRLQGGHTFDLIRWYERH